MPCKGVGISEAEFWSFAQFDIWITSLPNRTARKNTPSDFRSNLDLVDYMTPCVEGQMVSAILQFETIGDTKVGLNKCHHVDVWSPAARADLTLEHRGGLSFKTFAEASAKKYIGRQKINKKRHPMD